MFINRGIVIIQSTIAQFGMDAFNMELEFKLLKSDQLM